MEDSSVPPPANTAPSSLVHLPRQAHPEALRRKAERDQRFWICPNEKCIHFHQPITRLEAAPYPRGTLCCPADGERLEPAEFKGTTAWFCPGVSCKHHDYNDPVSKKMLRTRGCSLRCPSCRKETLLPANTRGFAPWHIHGIRASLPIPQGGPMCESDPPLDATERDRLTKELSGAVPTPPAPEVGAPPPAPRAIVHSPPSRVGHQRLIPTDDDFDPRAEEVRLERAYRGK